MVGAEWIWRGLPDKFSCRISFPAGGMDEAGRGSRFAVVWRCGSWCVGRG